MQYFEEADILVDLLFEKYACERWCDTMLVVSDEKLGVDAQFVECHGIAVAYRETVGRHVYDVKIPSPLTLPKWCDFLAWSYDSERGMNMAWFWVSRGVRVVVFDW